MKKILLLTFLCLIVIVKARPQVLLNEIYSDPGAGKHEFFELYNTSTLTTPLPLDNYTIVTFFEITGKRGFYVMDLPNLSINPRGFFVGASAIPFNYQGTIGSTAADFDWNSLAFTSNNGYLKKWVQGLSNPFDGNLFYDEAPLPANFNDFFYRRTANGASYTIFLYNNGQLINSFIGGTGGNNTIITAVVNMPPLFVDLVNPTGVDHTLYFDDYVSLPVESCTQDAGSDNGYIRERDGVCGLWDKSSAQVQHSPQMTNGGTADETTGVVAVSSVIAQGTAINGSYVNYDAVSGPVSAFPVTLQVYLDNGPTPNQLDAGDVFVEENIEASVSDGPFSTHFFPYDMNVLIVVKQNTGCIDKIVSIPNAKLLSSRLLSFEGNYLNGKSVLGWTISENESVDLFEVERSLNGKDYVQAGIIMAKSISGTENYKFYENVGETGQVFYRLRIVGKNKQSEYSRTLVFYTSASDNQRELKIINNPTNEKLTLSYASNTRQASHISIYDLNGRKLVTKTMQASEGLNLLSIPLGSSMPKGMYIAEILLGAERLTAPFVKQ